MNENGTGADKLIYYRLIALWVICEAMIGGIIHGMKIPVSGLIVGSCAVLLICLIAFHVPAKGAIIKATIIVAIFKLMLSPQSPPAAYLAVFFQGFVAELLFTNKKHFRLSCILLGFLALFESAIQRIVVLMIVYGNDFWLAVNEFIKRLLNETVTNNYSLYLAIGYIILHSIVGILIGWFAGIICMRTLTWKTTDRELVIDQVPDNTELKSNIDKKSSFKIRSLFIFLWLFLAVIVIQSYINETDPIIPLHISLKIFLRSVFIVLTWYIIISPLLISWMKKWLQKEKSRFQNDINEILLLLPSSKFILQKSWELSSQKTGLSRILFYIKILLINTLQSANDKS
jgi:ABC-type thiamin/hydroxymethylpyrimidine transport system permease subunit